MYLHGAYSRMVEHLISRVCREVRWASGAAMAIAPSGPRLLELWGWMRSLQRFLEDGRKGEAFAV